MISNKELEDLKAHLQTAVEVELSTIPLYLYTYYSINRQPNVSSLPKDIGNSLATFANKAGGVIMSVAVEEMLHLSLASNILKALGGSPKIYGKSPASYPTNLLEHKSGFSIGLQKLSKTQLHKFMEVELPAKPDAPAEGTQWETLGQFYKYIEDLIKKTTPKNYTNADKQLVDGKGYYAPNNIDTIYPKNASETGAKNVEYPNADDSGGLKQIKSKEDALEAIKEICEQGEGFTNDPTHKYDDPKHEEESHWYKYKSLHEQIEKFSNDELNLCVFDFPNNPITTNFPPKYQLAVELNNAVYSYLLWMTEKSFTLEGSAQSSMFYIGMHKGMIFILDKLIGALRAINVAPTFQNYLFKDEATAKKELVELAEYVAKTLPQLGIQNGILGRIKDLPDVHVVNNKVSFATEYTPSSHDCSSKGSCSTPAKKCPSKGGCGTPAQSTTTSHGCGTATHHASNGCGAKPAQCPSKASCGTPAQPTTTSHGCGTTTHNTSNGCGAKPAGQSGCGTKPSHTTTGNGCGTKPTPKNGCGASSCGTKPTKPAVIAHPKELHACMGLNACKGHDRTGKNDCAGTGHCATAAMHSCHTLNDCRNQGGCGLYGTAEEQNNPGNNDCSWQGSCAVPINAERFSTEGPSKNKSVWTVSYTHLTLPMTRRV